MVTMPTINAIKSGIRKLISSAIAYKWNMSWLATINLYSTGVARNRARIRHIIQRKLGISSFQQARYELLYSTILLCVGRTTTTLSLAYIQTERFTDLSKKSEMKTDLNLRS